MKDLRIDSEATGVTVTSPSAHPLFQYRHTGAHVENGSISMMHLKGKFQRLFWEQPRSTVLSVNDFINYWIGLMN